MEVDGYLIIGNNGSLNIRKTRPNLRNTEIAVRLRIDVPKQFFERLIPTVEINLPKEAVLEISEQEVVAVSAVELADNLSITYTEAYDGLMDMIHRAKAIQEDVDEILDSDDDG